MRRGVLIAGLAASVLGCGRAMDPDTGGTAAVHAAAGDTIRLVVGGTAIFGGAHVVFSEVADDSRCPINVDCVWAGDAEVRLAVTESAAAARTVTLHLHGEPREAVIGGLTVRLIDLQPAKVHPDVIRPADYSVRLEISRG